MAKKKKDTKAKKPKLKDLKAKKNPKGGKSIDKASPKLF